MKQRLLAAWAALTIPASPTALKGTGSQQVWRSPVASTRPYTSTLTIDFDHNGIAEVTTQAMTAILGDAGWQRLR